MHILAGDPLHTIGITIELLFDHTVLPSHRYLIKRLCTPDTRQVAAVLQTWTFQAVSLLTLSHQRAAPPRSHTPPWTGQRVVIVDLLMDF